ncbi:MULTISPECIES: hypothetical protein [unclassified Burkholderia]|uniref:hypothetical protein n=1 Tax=unclassified Burkholderia TaxID=2613784 RepID=UPI002AB22F1A|nr:MULTISPECIES: hypothetical protein [unclassified Burkholderia]
MLSGSFYGRDLLAAMAAWISLVEMPPDELNETAGLRVGLGADDLAEDVYVDHYGNGLGFGQALCPRTPRWP